MLKTGNPDIDNKKKFLVDSREELREINRKIIELGRKFNKITVATCDVHFMDPEDEIYRRIIQYGNGFKDADNQAPLYLRTTDEMLGEFDYLGSDLAEEVVITNPNKIADMIENISPIHPDKCPPVLDNSEENLRNICFQKAHEIYGEDLPKIVEDRLEIELDSIIGNGYAVMYIMAQRLVWKSNEDGYLVGSRGSVGSSFAATMSGITECNPLAPHYYCEKCKSSFFEDEYRAPEGTPIDEIKKIQATIKEEEQRVVLDLTCLMQYVHTVEKNFIRMAWKFLLKHSLDLVVQRNRISTLTSPVNTREMHMRIQKLCLVRAIHLEREHTQV